MIPAVEQNLAVAADLGVDVEVGVVVHLAQAAAVGVNRVQLGRNRLVIRLHLPLLQPVAGKNDGRAARPPVRQVIGVLVVDNQVGWVEGDLVQIGAVQVHLPDVPAIVTGLAHAEHHALAIVGNFGINDAAAGSRYVGELVECAGGGDRTEQIEIAYGGWVGIEDAPHPWRRVGRGNLRVQLLFDKDEGVGHFHVIRRLIHSEGDGETGGRIGQRVALGVHQTGSDGMGAIRQVVEAEAGVIEPGGGRGQGKVAEDDFVAKHGAVAAVVEVKRLRVSVQEEGCVRRIPGSHGEVRDRKGNVHIGRVNDLAGCRGEDRDGGVCGDTLPGDRHLG